MFKQKRFGNFNDRVTDSSVIPQTPGEFHQSAALEIGSNHRIRLCNQFRDVFPVLFQNIQGFNIRHILFRIQIKLRFINSRSG